MLKPLGKGRGLSDPPRRGRSRRWSSPYGSRDGRWSLETDRLSTLAGYLPGIDIGRLLTRLERRGDIAHPVAGATVIIPDFPRSWDASFDRARTDLKRFLRDRRLIRLTSGFRPEGYAVRLRTPDMAETFRRHWAGETLSPLTASMLGLHGLDLISQQITALEFA